MLVGLVRRFPVAFLATTERMLVIGFPVDLLATTERILVIGLGKVATFFLKGSQASM